MSLGLAGIFFPAGTAGGSRLTFHSFFASDIIKKARNGEAA
jgi:hypothetical protein